MFITALALVALSWQQGSLGENEIVKTEILMDSGAVVGKLLSNPPTADNFAEMGKLYIDKGKPLEAQRIFQAALSLDSKNLKALEGAEAADKKILYLNQRIQLFQSQIDEKPTETAYCSKAAILFHLGREQDAFEVFAEAQKTVGNKDDIAQLGLVFQQGINLNRKVLQYCDAKLSSGVAGKDAALMLEGLSEIVFLRFGKTDLNEVFGKYKAALGEKLNAESVALLVKAGLN